MLLEEKVTKKKRVHCRMTLIKLQYQCNTLSHPQSKTTSWEVPLAPCGRGVGVRGNKLIILYHT